MARFRYDAAQESLTKPVSADEASELYGMAGKPVARKASLTHFLYRVVVTLQNHEASNRNLSRELERAQQAKRRQGQPTTLSPLDAVRFATPEELEAIVGNLSSQQLHALQDSVATSRRLQSRLVDDLARVRRVVAIQAERCPDPAVRDALEELVAQLPEDPDEVTDPRALELGRMAGVLHEAPPTTSTAPRNPEAPPAAAPTSGPFAPTPGAPEAAGKPPSGSTPGRELVVLRQVADLRQYDSVPAWSPDPGASA